MIEQENKSLEGKRYGEEEWTIVQKPKEKVGLGVINLRLKNDALLLKQHHKFYSQRDVPWVNLIWSTYDQNKIPHASRGWLLSMERCAET